VIAAIPDLGYYEALIKLLTATVSLVAPLLAWKLAKGTNLTHQKKTFVRLLTTRE